MIVSGSEPFAQIVGAAGGLIPGRGARSDAALQHFDAGIGIWVEEECDRISILDRDSDPVGSGDVYVVGPAHQAITNVANECARDVGCIEPDAVSCEYLEAGNPNGAAG